ncbi:MAG TPA: efflux RND transporter periplasmic adaptor subunit, partial [Phormidium sp.]
DVTNARQNLTSKQAQRQSTQSNLAFQQQEFRRFSQLQGQGAVTRQALDQRRLDLQRAQADLAQIEAEIRAQQATIARAEANITKQERLIQQQTAGATEQRVRLNYYTINAPFAGVIGDIPVKVGDFASSSSELYTIADNRTLLIQANVPVEQATRLRMGMPVKLIDNQGKPMQTGQISFIAPNIDPQSQSILVKASFDNSNGSLRTDQFVRSRIIWDTRPGVVVPVTAISRMAGQNFVFVVERAPNSDKPGNMIARQTPVELGKITANQQEVLKGLQPGQEIVVAGILQLRDGAPIMPESQAPGADAPGAQGNKAPSN